METRGSQVVSRNLQLALKLVTALNHCKMAGAERDDANLLFACALGLWFRNQSLRRLELGERRSMLFSSSSGRSEYNAFSLWPDPRVKYAAAGWSVPGNVR